MCMNIHIHICIYTYTHTYLFIHTRRSAAWAVQSLGEPQALGPLPRTIIGTYDTTNKQLCALETQTDNNQ